MTDTDRMLIDENLTFCNRLPEDVLQEFFNINGLSIDSEEINDYFDKFHFNDEQIKELVERISSSECSKNTFIELFSDEVARNKMAAQEVFNFIKEGFDSDKNRISQDEIEEIAYPEAGSNTKDKSYKLHASL